MTSRSLSYALDGPADAPVIVLSGSLGTTREMWLPQVTALHRDWRLLRIDHPGHGDSPVWDGRVTIEDIGRASLDLLDVLGYERVSWCGLSLGGAVGQWVAAHARDRIDHLILCCTSARFDSPDVYRQRAETVRKRGMQSVADGVVERWFTGSFRERQPDVVARYRSMLESVPAEGYAACCDAVAGFDARPYLAEITAPTLVIAGGEDQATPVEHARTLCGGILHSRLELIPNAAHLANVERPGAVTRAIYSHLQGERVGGRPMIEDQYQRGITVRREVLGDTHVERALATDIEFTGEFQDFITRYAWGEIWARPGLDRRTRSAITLTALIALGHEKELALHLRAAIRNGLTHAEIKEILLHSAIYCGVPAANSAFRIASEILNQDGVE
jgi:3-oxoadipate enol-lactonase/4-carboxymuconolactone decarboxylase